MKAQGPIDLLMLVFLLSTSILALSIFAGNDSLQVLSIKANSIHDKKTLLSTLQRQVELNVNGTTLMRGRAIDLIAFQACNGCPPGEFDYCVPLRNVVNSTLFVFNQGQKHYLFSVTSASGAVNLTTFDNQSSVCLERLPLARFSHNTTCGEPFTIVYASWFNWQQVQQVC